MSNVIHVSRLFSFPGQRFSNVILVKALWIHSQPETRVITYLANAVSTLKNSLAFQVF